MARRSAGRTTAISMVLVAAACGGGGGGQTGTSDDGGCPDGVCLPTETPDDGTEDADGTVGPDTETDDSTGMLPPDGVCDPTTCEAWDIADPPDGSAQRVCNDPDCETTTTLPALDENYFRCKVMGVFQEGCGFMGCHSPQTPARQLRLYQRWHAREAPLHSGAYDYEGPNTCMGGVHQSVQCGRHPLTGLEWATNFDSARLFALDLMAATDSQLLLQPLAGDPAGLEHDGFDIWANESDARYQTILSWLEGATEAADCGSTMLPGDISPFDYFQFACPQCGVNGQNCADSGQTAPCDPNACLP